MNDNAYRLGMVIRMLRAMVHTKGKYENWYDLSYVSDDVPSLGANALRLMAALRPTARVAFMVTTSQQRYREKRRESGTSRRGAAGREVHEPMTEEGNVGRDLPEAH